jgi:septum formation protein
MKKIILASNSPQRKKLLALLGFNFIVCPSHVPEVEKITSTAANLVKQNAYRKAQDVAARVRKGIVIGSDTIIYLGGKKILGKPRTLNEAKQTLRALFIKPRWVYTGLAVIDAATGKMLVDYEKTRVFMSPLTNQEMDRYHKKVNPFDKAGGFDIEGWGSIFIHRIEGCYSNVIGLPMAKLHQMLKKFGVSAL